jgi:hypothetical protein
LPAPIIAHATSISPQLQTSMTPEPVLGHGVAAQQDVVNVNMGHGTHQQPSVDSSSAQPGEAMLVINGGSQLGITPADARGWPESAQTTTFVGVDVFTLAIFSLAGLCLCALAMNFAGVPPFCEITSTKRLVRSADRRRRPRGKPLRSAYSGIDMDDDEYMEHDFD